MKTNTQKILAFAAFFTASLCFAQAESVSKQLSVSATVQEGGVSELDILNGSTVTFNNGNPIVVGNGSGPLKNRFMSSEVELSYFVRSGIGAWDLLIYSQRSDNEIGMFNTNGDSIPLKFNLKGTNGAYSDIGVDTNWTGQNAAFSFVTDRGNSQPADNNVSRLTSSTENESTGYNPSLKFKFGTELAGAVAGAYSADITIELYVQ